MAGYEYASCTSTLILCPSHYGIHLASKLLLESGSGKLDVRTWVRTAKLEKLEVSY